MKHDFDLIVHKLDRGLDHINLYPIGDAHNWFFAESYLRWKKEVLNDPNGYVVLVGDMIDNTLKDSKGDCFENIVRPRTQKEWLKEEMRALHSKVLGAVRGNHEERSTRHTDDCPLYDVMSKYDIEDLYRENMAFMKIALGTKSKDRQFAYGITLAHGGSLNKTKNFSYAIDGMDVMISGHTHQPDSSFPAKIVIDMQNEVVTMKDFTRIVVPSFQSFGGYALKGMYMPQSSSKFPIIRLSGTEKGVEVTWK